MKSFIGTSLWLGVISKRSLFFLALAVSIVNSSGYASTIECRSSFRDSLEVKKQSTKLQSQYSSLISSRREFDRQIKDGVPVKQLQLTQTSEIKGTLKFMRAELNKLLNFELNPRISHLKGQLDNTIIDLQRDFEAVSENLQISYLNYYNLSRRFSFAMNFKNTPHVDFYDNPFMKDAFMRLVLADLLRISMKDSLTCGESVEFVMPNFILPIKEKLDVKKMNDLLALGIAPLGITTEVIFADGNKYLPSFFFHHDYAHAVVLDKKPETRLASLQFYRRFESFVRSTSDERVRLIRRQLWFIAFHEGAPGAVNPENFRKDLERNITDDSIFARFGNPQDLGEPFKGNLINKIEFLNEIKNTIEFLNRADDGP